MRFLQNTIFDTWKKTDFLSQKIRLLWIFILILCLLNILLWAGWKSQPSEQRLYLTPAMILQGGDVKPNVITKEYVQSLAYQIFVALNIWKGDAVSDYKKSLSDYRYYLTPRYLNYLIKDYRDNLENSNLASTTQVLSPDIDDASRLSGSTVDIIDNNSWLVHLNFRVTRYKDASVLMDAAYRYDIRVVRVAKSIEVNPYGLALDGINNKELIKTYL